MSKLDTRRRNQGKDLRKLDAPKGRAKPVQGQGDNNDSSLAWVGVHWRELVEHYPNRRVLIADQKVAADAATPSELAKEARRLVRNTNCSYFSIPAPRK